MRISDWSSDVCSSDLDERPIMALVNNAAVQRLAKTSAVTMADWDESITVNLTAPMRLSQALLPELAANDGIILNIGSVHAGATKKKFVSYATSKAAIHGLTRALPIDQGPDIRVVCPAPAAVSSPMLPPRSVGQDEALAQFTRSTKHLEG